MSSKVSRDWRGIEEVGELDGRAFHGLTNLSVWTLSSCLFCFRMCVCVQKKTSTKARPTKPTQFRYFYERGDFPIALGHSTRGNIIQWKVRGGLHGASTFDPPPWCCSHFHTHFRTHTHTLPLTHSPTHPLTHSLLHSLTHSLTQKHTFSLCSNSPCRR